MEHLGRKRESKKVKIDEVTGKGKKSKKENQKIMSFKDKKYNDFRDMPVWLKAFALLTEVYKLIKHFPPDEQFALTDDLKRAANSVVHNLAEGYGRFEPRDKTRFYKISRGSAFESMSQILVAESQEYLSSETAENLIKRYKEIIEELNSLIFFLEK